VGAANPLIVARSFRINACSCSWTGATVLIQCPWAGSCNRTSSNWVVISHPVSEISASVFSMLSVTCSYLAQSFLLGD
jgi:hypothetical protein